MSVWRVIITDSESLSGVAPVCPRTETNHHLTVDSYLVPTVDSAGVYDCCPRPHIECYSEQHAKAVADALTAAEAEVCT